MDRFDDGATLFGAELRVRFEHLDEILARAGGEARVHAREVDELHALIVRHLVEDGEQALVDRGRHVLLLGGRLGIELHRIERLTGRRRRIERRGRLDARGRRRLSFEGRRRLRFEGWRCDAALRLLSVARNGGRRRLRRAPRDDGGGGVPPVGDAVFDFTKFGSGAAFDGYSNPKCRGDVSPRACHTESNMNEETPKGVPSSKKPGQSSMVAQIALMQDYDRYRDLAWEGSFEEYLSIVRERPQVTRNAFQRVYDMVISYGTEEYIDNKKKLVRYNFFRDEIDGGKDAVFGLDIPLMRLMNVLKAAAEGYGPERRVILLHGPVGSSKSTIARSLKKGLERYSATPEGALYTFRWVNLASTGLASGSADTFDSPMHEEPLRLIPHRVARRGGRRSSGFRTTSTAFASKASSTPRAASSSAACMQRYEGDWGKVIENHVRVKRLVLSREGPRRHRHLPAEGREEPGLDRAHRRHQLPKDRRVRLRFRSARVQLRRRVQHREPRHRRVRRGA